MATYRAGCGQERAAGRCGSGRWPCPGGGGRARTCARETMDAIVVPLEDRRLTQYGRLEAAQHGLGAAFLAAAAARRLQGSSAAERWFACALLLTCALLLWAAVRELRGVATAHGGWLSLAAGVVFSVEWADAWSGGGKLVQPALVLAVLSLLQFALYVPMQRIQTRRRRLRVDGEGVSFRLSPLRRFELRWAEVSHVQVEGAEVRFRCHDGRERRIPLRRLANAAEVADAVVRTSRRAGVHVLATAPAGG